MKTVELFAGIGGFRIAADRLHWDTLWANDVCPKACSVYEDRFGGKVLHRGDFAALKERVPPHDVLTAGFPCQPFSSAGKKKGVRDARGTLFQLIIDVLKKHRPQFFILENVKRLLTMEQGCHFATILGSLAELDYFIEWRLLNTMHFALPQNRERVVLIGWQRREGAEESATEATPNIRLAEAADLATLGGRARECLCDRETWRLISDHRGRFPTWGVAEAGQFFAADLDIFSAALQSVKLSVVLQEKVPEEFDFTHATLKWIAENTPINRFVNGVEILSNQRGGARMGYTIFGINGLAPTLTSTTSRHYERYKVGDRYRRLTNVEYARIQGFPDDHCRAVSVYDQYALFGNAVPPPLAEWAMQRLTNPGVVATSLRPKITQRTLFPLDYAV